MIAERFEPRGLAPTASPLADTKVFVRRQAAVIGSRELKEAILRAKGYRISPPAAVLPQFKLLPIERKPRGRPKGAIKVRCINAKIAQIQALVAAHFDMSVETLLGPARSYDIVRPRQVAMFLSRKSTGASLLDIAHQFGGRDHTTVINAIQRVAQRLTDTHSETLGAVWAVHKVIGG